MDEDEQDELFVLFFVFFVGFLVKTLPTDVGLESYTFSPELISGRDCTTNAKSPPVRAGFKLQTHMHHS